MKKMIEGTFSRFGAHCEIGRGEEKYAVRAFIQPITKETWDEPFSVGVLGAREESIWRYLGEAKVEVCEGDTVQSKGERYRVRRAAAVTAGDEITHYWAVLAKEDRA